LVGVLRFQKQFDVDISDFQFELCYRYFGIFRFRDFLDQLFEKLGNLFAKTSGHPGPEKVPVDKCP
jgi:hypothetical protein